LETVISITDATLYCDKDLVFQTFANIIDNAIKFNQAGGSILITLDAAKLGDQKHVAFRVYDSGMGVSEPDFDKLTRRFYRADKSRTRSGNGLGLSLVQAIVNLHEGLLRFVDNPLSQASGLGCEVMLPLKKCDD
jgi:signal transduction histidine kinase